MVIVALTIQSESSEKGNEENCGLVRGKSNLWGGGQVDDDDDTVERRWWGDNGLDRV